MTNYSSGNTDTAELTSTADRDGGNHKVNTANLFERWLARMLLSAIGNPPIGLAFGNGVTLKATERPGPLLIIRDLATLLKLLFNPEYNFGELYTQGRIEVDGNLVELLCLVFRALYFRDRPQSTGLVSGLLRKLGSGDTFTTARRNIHHHYDIGNRFYEKWLDQEMQYTCAYFAEPDYTLEQAQIAKMHHVCRKLMLRPGLSVVEAGCGWGGLARFMAREYGVNVKAYNISREQIDYARQRATREDLQDTVEYIEDDYRNIRGKFDRFVSVGMLEHVGIENYRELGRVIDRCLNETGTGLIHSIGFNHPDYLNPWIEKRIFPGACPPSISQMMDIFEPRNFSILDIENLRLHYATTLEEWLLRFNRNVDQIQAEFDEEFIRAWRLYLSGSMSAFLTGSMQLFQVVFSRPNNNNLPWSRSHLYKDS
jgi:cyclopropane-fatty-acyl-phospholipid synthase